MTTTRHTLAWGALLLVTLTPQAALADWMIASGGGDRAIPDESFDYLSDDDRSFISSGFLTVQREAFYEFYLGVEYTWATEDAEPFSGLSTHLNTTGLLAVARLEHEVAPWFVPYLQVGAGAYYARLEVKLDDETRQQGVWVPGMSQLGGLEFRLPKPALRKVFGSTPNDALWNFTAGLAIEAGYLHVGTATFDDLQRPAPQRTLDPDEAPLPASPLSFGEVDLSGPMLRFALHVRF
ncbi:MAG: hypothetical protein CMH57_01570 [Myxococcales bacterium]|nr:hypothetical protein [Myxococcales bacterium]